MFLPLISWHSLRVSGSFFWKILLRRAVFNSLGWSREAYERKYIPPIANTTSNTLLLHPLNKFLNAKPFLQESPSWIYTIGPASSTMAKPVMTNRRRASTFKILAAYPNLANHLLGRLNMIAMTAKILGCMGRRPRRNDEVSNGSSESKRRIYFRDSEHVKKLLSDASGNCL